MPLQGLLLPPALHRQTRQGVAIRALRLGRSHHGLAGSLPAIQTLRWAAPGVQGHVQHILIAVVADGYQ